MATCIAAVRPLNFDLKFEIIRETPWKVLIIIVMKDEYTHLAVLIGITIRKRDA
jgi:hypothetical protein